MPINTCVGFAVILKQENKLYRFSLACEYDLVEYPFCNLEGL